MLETRLAGPLLAISLLVTLSWSTGPGHRLLAAENTQAAAVAAAVGIHGGLCVQLGGEEIDTVASLAAGGRFLIQILVKDLGVAEELRPDLGARGLVGQVSADRLPGNGKLPYTENLVNLLVIQGSSITGLSAGEALRVLTPSGVVLAAPGTWSESEIEEAGLEETDTVQWGTKTLKGWRKPWPADMDEWSHPRHSSTGNPVSGDRIVGPPRRIRWLAGPWEEISTMVTASGKIFYGGVLARDAFNGLRLWEKRLTPSPAAGGFGFRITAGSVAPVVGGGRLFVFTEGSLRALDVSTGHQVREYALEAETGERPRQILHDRGMLLVVSPKSVRAFDTDRGVTKWKQPAIEARAVVAGGDLVAYIEGNARRGGKVEAVALERETGAVRWKHGDSPWLARVTHCVYHEGRLAYESSSLNDNSPGNSLHVLAAADGKPLFERVFPPAMSHMRQARAMFIGSNLWILHGGRISDKKRLNPQLMAIDPASGDVQKTLAAGLAHCFPPVATERYLLTGEMDFTDLETGRLDANQITKAACSRDGGWVPANGLVYVAPKHCVCWPMLRGYAALAAARPGGNPALKELNQIEFPLEVADAGSSAIEPPASSTTDGAPGDWPSYRHDAWRSGSTVSPGPGKLETVWSVDLGRIRPDGPLGEDWDENPYANGPISAPVIAGKVVCVARPDAHQVVALDALDGSELWRFTAGGRVDTAPTIYRGLCLFGDRTGQVHCRRAADGRPVWSLRAAPLDERIVAYGQVESPWPVPGSVLVTDGIAYFAAGRQSLADGGILLFAVKPASGEIRWVRRLDSLPQKGFYRSTGLEFDNFDLLHREGDSVAMSRWLFGRSDGAMSIEPLKAFAKLDTGGGAALVPQGCWSYAPRHIRRTKYYTRRRSLVAFRGNLLVGCLQGMRTIFRRDFDWQGGEKFDDQWMTGWKAASETREGRMPWRTNRLAEKATWTVDVFKPDDSAELTIDALILAGDAIYLATAGGELQVRAVGDGELIARRPIPTPLWNGLALAGGRVFLSTLDGKVLCLGDAAR